MKAFLLAGGRGERLRPLTDRIPKCLVPVNGRPLLEYWLALCEREGIGEVLLNVSHHFDAVDRLLAARAAGRVRVHVAREAGPAGTATSVRRERSFVAGEDSFWIFYADNLTDMRLEPMYRLHATHMEPLTMGMFRTGAPQSAGIASLDQRGRVIAFTEKPLCPAGNLANAGVYLARQTLFDCIPDDPPAVDFGLHVLPRLVGHMAGYEIPEFYEDIGTPERLSRASAAWKRLSSPPAAVASARRAGRQS